MKYLGVSGQNVPIQLNVRSPAPQAPDDVKTLTVEHQEYGEAFRFSGCVPGLKNGRRAPGGFQPMARNEEKTNMGKAWAKPVKP